MTHVICWTCHLPIPTLQTPIGEIADPQHNCIEALKTEVARLRQMVKIDLNRTGWESTEPQMSQVPTKNLLPSNAIRDGSDVAL